MSSNIHSSIARSGTPTRTEIQRTAADWIARRNDGELSLADQTRLRSWLAADAAHANAFAELDALWNKLNEPRRHGLADAVSSDLNRRARRRRMRAYVWTTAGLAATAALLIALGPLAGPEAPTGKDQPSIAVRPNVRVLPDGSTVELNFGAEIAVNYSAERRGVRLVHGEALFAVTRDPTRPFVVNARGIEVRAMGTAFVVREESKQVNVLVTEGQVAVGQARESASAETALPAKIEPVFVEVGRQVTVPIAPLVRASLEVKKVSTAELAVALAWRGNRIEFRETPLTEALDLFNRQNRVQLTLADRTLGRRLISGIFWADDPEGFVRLVETAFNVQSERSGYVIKLHRE